MGKLSMLSHIWACAFADDKMEPERDAAELADATDLELQDAGPMLPEAIAEALAAEVAAEVAEVSKR